MSIDKQWVIKNKEELLKLKYGPGAKSFASIDVYCKGISCDECIVGVRMKNNDTRYRHRLDCLKIVDELLKHLSEEEKLQGLFNLNL